MSESIVSIRLIAKYPLGYTCIGYSPGPDHRKQLMMKTLAALALAVTVVLGLAACSAAAEPIELAEGTVIVDVRTPSEFAAGHLDGAINVDVQSASFDTDISALSTDGDYVVYCASGSRSASAVTRMTDLGFSTLTDARGMSDAAASTGLAIVTAP